jgi:hypothetical protein
MNATQDPIEELFKDKQYCFDEINRIRQLVSTTDATVDTWDSAFSTMGFMVLYCPSEISALVHSQLNELTVRHGYFIQRLLSN